MLQNLLRLAFAVFLFVGGTGLVVCQATGHGINGVAPWQTGPVSVLIVEETEDHKSLTGGQLDAMNPNGTLRREYLKTHGEPDPCRVLDKDDSPEQIVGDKWKTAFAAKGATVPWLLVLRNGKVLLSEPLPKTEEETLRDVSKFGGH